MKITKLQWTIHAIIAFVYTTAMFMIWDNKGDVRFWFFMVSTWLIIANSLYLCNYINKSKDNKSVIMDLSAFVIPIATYVLIIVLTVTGPKLTHYNASLYTVLHLVVFATSAIAQIVMLKGRQTNINQNKEIVLDVLNRDELIRIWTKIVSASINDEEFNKLAKKIENEVRYSDPIVPVELADVEKEIHDKSSLIYEDIKNGDAVLSDTINKAQEIYELVKERNNKGRILK